MKIVPSWREISRRVRNQEHPLNTLRHTYLKHLNEYTGRNIITYYSAFIQKPGFEGLAIDDNDKNAFMQAMCGLDKSKGLDLILHTPGGNIAATESIVYYLREMFGKDIRVIIPQIAMSAGTMIALSSKEIIMGKQSNLGPIDPQFGGMSCAGIIEEFERAKTEVAQNPNLSYLWSPIIGKYHPTFIGDCQKAVEWAEKIVKEWLKTNMFSKDKNKDAKADSVVSFLSSHNDTYSHSRHIHTKDLKKLGIKVKQLEGFDNRTIGDCKDFQDCVLTLHHSYMHSLAETDAMKIVENHVGELMCMIARQQGGQN